MGSEIGGNNIDFNEKVDTYINSDKTGNISRLSQILPLNIVNKITSMTIPVSNIQDRMYWRTSKNGWFSIASAMEIVTKTISHHKSYEWFYLTNTSHHKVSHIFPKKNLPPTHER